MDTEILTVIVTLEQNSVVDMLELLIKSNSLCNHSPWQLIIRTYNSKDP